MKPLISVCSTFLFALLLSACAHWNATLAPEGHAIIREHSIGKVAFGNQLPVNSSLDFTITEVDGAPVVRETIPAWVDLQRGVLVTAGAHRFKVLAQPHLLPKDYQPRELSFGAKVEGGKVYRLVDKDEQPALMEEPRKP